MLLTQRRLGMVLGVVVVVAVEVEVAVAVVAITYLKFSNCTYG
jgi:hypothetical protein